MTVSSSSMPTVSRWRRPERLTVVLLLLAFVWISLSAYVMVPARLGALHHWVLLPSIPAAIAIYVLLLRMFARSTVAVIGISMVMFWVLVAVTVPYLPLLDPNRPVAPYQMPFSSKGDLTFWLGTDMRGRDVLSRTLWGCQRVIVWGITATFSGYVVGAFLGLVAGYLGGWWDEVLSFLGNMVLSFPVMILLILVLNYLGQSGFNIIIAVTCSSAPAIMRIVRGLAMDTRGRDYIQAAQTRGENAFWIMFVEILPNVRGPLIVDACLRLGYTTVMITTLTFLGLGLQPPDPDWGLMIKEAASSALLWKFAYMIIAPSIAVSTLILGFNLLADGLRELSQKD